MWNPFMLMHVPVVHSLTADPYSTVCITQFIYLFTSWMFGLFPAFSNYKQNAINIHIWVLCEHNFSFLLGKYSEEGFLSLLILHNNFLLHIFHFCSNLKYGLSFDKIFYWSLVDLQYGVSSQRTSELFSYTCSYSQFFFRFFPYNLLQNFE